MLRIRLATLALISISLLVGCAVVPTYPAYGPPPGVVVVRPTPYPYYAPPAPYYGYYGHRGWGYHHWR